MQNELDPYDGVPADTIPPRPRDPSEDYDIKGEIVPCESVQEVYAVLTVWDHADSDVYSYGDGGKHENARRVNEFNNDCKHGRSYLVRIPVPEYVPPAK